MTLRTCARLLCVCVAIALASCGGDGATDSKVERGGVYRLADPSFYLTGAFDPSSEYAYQPWTLYGGMLLRTLVSYKHVAGVPGSEVVPDLATALPDVSEDGLTYTFHLRSGVKFGPPVDREITSADVAYAFERMTSASVGAQYGFYYFAIDGFDIQDGPPKSISGIETPDDQTIVFHLTAPTGDFLARLTLPATAPIPEEVAKCFTGAGDYGRYVISSGPYMFEGSDQLDISSCSAMKPIAGADPSQRLSFVRNPNYDPKTDDPAVRENLIDGLVWTINPNVQDIFNRIEAGDLDGTTVPPPAKVLQKYTSDSSLRDRLKINPANRTWPLAMNLTQPPFDDLHVRKAANWVMDKAALQRTAGGSLAHPVAQHMVPDILVQNALTDYAPFATPGNSGDLEKAKTEMSQSRYDTDHDGICDASACANVLVAIPTYPPATTMQASLRQSLAKIGIQAVVRQFNDPYATFGNATKNLPANMGLPLSADYPDPFGFYSVLEGPGIVSQGNFNWSLIGLKPDQAKELGIKGNVEQVPGADAEIEQCQTDSGEERASCFADVDRVMMESVVPWVPLFKDVTVTVIGSAVTKFDFDQAQGYQSFAHVALDPSKQ